MKRLIIALMLLTTTTAFAHIQKGTYQGTDQNGKSCAFTVGGTWFEDEFEHPLSERVELTKMVFADFKPVMNHFQAGHPPVVNLDSGLVRFNHDLFQDVIPTLVGAVSVTILKGESEEGSPKGIIYIEDNYKNKNESKKVTCLL
jgi:ABC-type cobalt transport system substrate-binding protein